MAHKVLAASVVALLLFGCESKEAQMTKLQQKYQLLQQQDLADCYALDLDRGNTQRVAKCNAEEARMKTLEAQIRTLTQEMTQ